MKRYKLRPPITPPHHYTAMSAMEQQHHQLSEAAATNLQLHLWAADDVKH